MTEIERFWTKTRADGGCIRRRCAAGETQAVVAKDFKIHQVTVSKIVTGKLWRRTR